MKRFLSLLLVAVMLLSVVITSASAEDVAPTHPFTDVAGYEWATASLNKMYEKGIINGTSATTFDPEGKFTREMMVTMFWRLEGSESNGATPEQLAGIFTDGASVSDWARQAVLWAYTNNVVSGYPEGDFRPQNVVTRQEAAVFIYNYAQTVGITLPVVSDLVLADTLKSGHTMRFTHVSEQVSLPEMKTDTSDLSRKLGESTQLTLWLSFPRNRERSSTAQTPTTRTPQISER